MKVTLLQVNVDERETYQQRLERVVSAIEAEKGQDLVVLPELWAHGGFAYDAWNDGEDLDGPIHQALSAAAKSANCYVHSGGIVERNPKGRPHNTSAIFDRDGQRIAVYRKIHLYGFNEGEAVLFEPGSECVIADTSFGKIGLATCFDIRFPELFRKLIDRDARIFLIPSAWPVARIEHWRALLIARAIENQAFVMGCATSGSHGGKKMGGFSAVVDPNGNVIAEASADKDEALRAQLDLSQIDFVRREFPVLNWRRVGISASI